MYVYVNSELIPQHQTPFLELEGREKGREEGREAEKEGEEEQGRRRGWGE